MSKKIDVNGQNIRDLTGKKVGQFTAIRFDHKLKKSSAFWLFKCDCGNERILQRHMAKEQINCGCIEVKKPEMSLKDRVAKVRMAKNREKQKANKRKFKQEENVGTKNAFGFTDLTPYNAINGKDALSKPTLTDMKHEVSGGFNTAKK